MISIKEVSKQTGVTVRTLRYYDEIHLLSPAGKTKGGHRLYGEKELKKLQEIQFLKTIGFRLVEIKEMLSRPNWDWAKSLEDQLNYIVKEKEKIIEMERTLRGLMNSLLVDGTIDFIRINKLIELYQNDNEKRMAYRKRLFDEEEEDMLPLLPNMNRGDPDSMEWISLVAQLKRQMDKGIEAPEIQRIVRRMHEKMIETFGDNEAFFDKVWEIRKSKEKSTEMGFYPMEQEVIDFFEQAWEVLMEEERKRGTS